MELPVLNHPLSLEAALAFLIIMDEVKNQNATSSNKCILTL
jgi:hypothetical protein